ncbi:hypothetical protein RBQ61_17560 [Sedimentibacter sp. MB35-C1]|uniref:hypothetical protein n=1 Tax=Sedimentibacter sp. MB35-C1 TaxID=3070995 RepID=UPI0027E20D51|nr:hypothetical protein [Sedimentibacter sp. MB35-C1]WMJ77346.1 hypothetical protein RBQ61_17560 [Sedimentibacter sp. MB35-C1]
MQGFLEENGLDINVVLDEDMSVAGTYGVRSFPTTISINKKGEAVQRICRNAFIRANGTALWLFEE